MDKIEKIAYGVFFVIGLVFVFIGIGLTFTLYNYSNKVETVGVITRIDENYGTPKVYVSYNVNDETRQSTLNSYSSNFKVGKELKIYYDKDNVSKIGNKETDLVFLVFPVMGLIFTIIGSVGLFKNTDKLSKLKETGELLYADYEEVDINKHYSVNGVHPYNIICNLKEPDGTIRKVKSVSLWTDPSDIIMDKNITRFPVYVNSKNRKKYYMDITDVEKYL